MTLWTDVIDPAELSGYARESLAAYEQRKGTLARWLPNREVSDIVVRFVMGQAGLIDEARWRAFDAPPEVGKRATPKRTTVELLAVGQDLPISEYEQLRLRNADDDSVLAGILKTTDQAVQAVSDSVERLRGVTIDTGKATVTQSNFTNDDDFGRDPAFTFTLGSLWSTSSVDRLSAIQAAVDAYIAKNGDAPGCMVGSNRVFRALGSGSQFQLQLVNGISRPGSEADVQSVISGAGFPPFIKYDRRTKAGRVTPDDRLYFLPAPVETDAPEDTELGATFWGQTLTSMLPEYGIAESDMPGIVVGTYRNDKPPAVAEVISDAIALPVLANADLSMAVKVL